jgi:hypothetical protein
MRLTLPDQQDTLPYRQQLVRFTGRGAGTYPPHSQAQGDAVYHRGWLATDSACPAEERKVPPTNNAVRLHWRLLAGVRRCQKAIKLVEFLLSCITMAVRRAWEPGSAGLRASAEGHHGHASLGGNPIDAEWCAYMGRLG